VPQWAAAMPPRVFVYFVFLSWGLPLQNRLASNLRSSYLSLPGGGITGMHTRFV
jgi:hypothetical protein